MRKKMEDYKKRALKFTDQNKGGGDGPNDTDKIKKDRKRGHQD